jgi:N-acyl-D-aspartate/D-glutamate deacylase
MPLAEAIHKITGKPASRLGFSQRGLLREGYAADLAVFDAGAIECRATYETPSRSPRGIAFVIKGGEVSTAEIRIP